MSLNALWHHLDTFVPARLKKPQKHIYSYNEFCCIIDRERSRSDRFKQGFTVVCFEMMKCKKENKLSCEHLVRVLADRRIRSTDEVGWFDKRCIGIVLHNATPEDAWDFADNILEALRAKPYGVHLPRCKIYTYPGDWRNDNNTKNSGNFGSENTSSLKNGTALKSPILFKEEVMYGSEELKCQQVSVMDEDCARPVERLERIFIRRIHNMKRIVDIAGAALCLVIFSPIILIVAIAIKIESKGPIIFKQQRCGLGGKPFTFYKFRSMVNDAEYQKKHLRESNERKGPVFKMTNDPRITSIGKYIRRWSIDELPQFFNVLKGDMSIVGPRPPTLDEVPEYDNWHNRRLDVKPGITCIWQAYARHDKCFDTWVRMDIEYARRQSLLFDLKILLKTVPAVFLGKGAH